MKHYYIEQPDNKKYTIQFDKLSDGNVLACVEIPEPSTGERYFGVKIPLDELKHAYDWLSS